MAGVIGSSSTAFLASRPSKTSILSLSSSSPGQSRGRKFYGGIGFPVKKGRSRFHVSISNAATELSPAKRILAQKLAKESQRPVYPFAAIVGQDEMKLCLLLNVIDPKIGGVMIMGDRGTGKSTTIRSLVDLLLKIKVVVGDPFNSDPEYPEAMGMEVREKIIQGEELPVTTTKINMVDLPVCGTIDIEKALTEGVKAFEPGLLAKANRGILYVDKVNLLDDHLVDDVLLDSAASGWNTVERGNFDITSCSVYSYWIKKSGRRELRPQLLDRFGMHAQVGTVRDAELRVKIVEERAGLIKIQKNSGNLTWQSKISSKSKLPQLGPLFLLFRLIMSFGSKSLAALKGRDNAQPEDIATVIPNSLRHRRLRKDPLESIDSGVLVIEKFYEVFTRGIKRTFVLFWLHNEWLHDIRYYQVRSLVQN